MDAGAARLSVGSSKKRSKRRTSSYTRSTRSGLTRGASAWFDSAAEIASPAGLSAR